MLKLLYSLLGLIENLEWEDVGLDWPTDLLLLSFQGLLSQLLLFLVMVKDDGHVLVGEEKQNES